jgi:hypothetical protein
MGGCYTHMGWDSIFFNTNPTADKHPERWDRRQTFKLCKATSENLDTGRAAKQPATSSTTRPATPATHKADHSHNQRGDEDNDPQQTQPMDDNDPDEDTDPNATLETNDDGCFCYNGKVTGTFTCPGDGYSHCETCNEGYRRSSGVEACKVNGMSRDCRTHRCVKKHASD